MEKVFFVSGIEMRPPRVKFCQRTFLWLPTYEEAEKYVLKDYGGISEGGTNRFVCIEGVRPIFVELYPDPQVFFEFIGDWETDGHYEKLEKMPKEISDYFENNYLTRLIATIG